MSYEREHPLKIAITGIDGAGKSTTLNRVVEQLGPEVSRIVTLGRKPYSVVDNQKRCHYGAITFLVDHLHQVADHTYNRRAVLATNALNVVLQGRFIEPSLVRKVQPELVMGARDYLLDSAVYVVVYSRSLKRLDMEDRIGVLKRLSGIEYRNMIFFLTVPPDEAVARIEKRIAEDQSNPYLHERVKWRHMHENPETLDMLQRQYYDAFRFAQSKSPANIYEINTADLPQEEVVGYITDKLRDRLSGAVALDTVWSHFPKHEPRSLWAGIESNYPLSSYQDDVLPLNHRPRKLLLI